MFTYARNIESDEPIMVIDRHIGFDQVDGMGVNGSLFSEELMRLDEMGKKRIQVWINSVGGVVTDGYSIVMAILKSKTKVDTYCCGIAASIAGVVFQAGRKRIMCDYGILMYHNPYSGNVTDSPSINAMKESLNTIISERSGMNTDQVKSMMDRTSFINATEAYDMGLCDEIEQTADLNKRRMATVSAEKAYWKESAMIMNKFLETKKYDMKQIVNKLGLGEQATEEEIVNSIDKIRNENEDLRNSNKVSQDEINKMKKDMEEAENKFKKLKDEYDKACNELEAAKNEAKKLEDDAKEAKAKAMVDEFVKKGVVKKEDAVVNKWVGMAKTEFDGTKQLLESIPVNKKSEKIPYQDNAGGGKDSIEERAKAGVAADMAEISNRIKK